MSIKQNIKRAKADYDAVYTEGKQDEYDRFWMDVLTNGERKGFNSAFSGWSGEYMRPPIKIVPTNAGLSSTFNGCKELKKIEAAHFDFSQLPYGDSGQTSYYYTFYNCVALEEIEDVGFSPAYSYSTTFGNCAALKKIAKITVDVSTRFSNTFAYCLALEDVVFEGEIGTNGLSFNKSINLSKASITSVINALSTNTSGLTVTFSKTAVNKAFETSENAKDGAESAEWKTLIATKSNWTISLA